MPTIAENIAARFGDDGQTWKDEGGVQLVDILTEHAIMADTMPEDGDVTRYFFADDSTIVTTTGGWDIGCPADLEGCWCWQEVAHADGCPHS